MSRSLIHLDAGDKPAAAAAMELALSRDPRLRLENPAGEPVKDPREGAVLFVGVLGGALDPDVLDRFFDWKAVHTKTAVGSPSLGKLSAAEFRRVFKQSYRNRPPQIDAASLLHLRSTLDVAHPSQNVAIVTGPGLRRPLRFYRSAKGWTYRG